MRPTRLLTVAGSDSGGGAGIQADLKTFAALGGHGMSAVTAVTAQNTCAVTAVHPLPPGVVAAQIDAVFDDIGVDAVKVGMLGSRDIVRAVAERLRAHAGPPLVVDPVMVAKTGARLLDDDAVATLRGELLPLASVVTPNLPEAAELTGVPVQEGEEARAEAARRLAADCGAAVLVKGGHAAGAEVVDLLLWRGEVRRFAHPRVATSATHGTGCTLSAAIAARLGAGDDVPTAVGRAIDYLEGALRAAFPLGSGHGPVNHFHRLWSVEATR